MYIRQYRASRPAVFECTEAGIEVLTVIFGRCDRLAADNGKCYSGGYEQGNDREVTYKMSRYLP